MTTTQQPSGPQRVFARTAPYAPSLCQCYDAARLLAESTIGAEPAVTAVIGIANGGVKPATVAADFLKVPLYVASARHNASDQPWQQATGQVTVTLPDDLPPLFTRRVLLVDDIAGSGATFLAVAQALHGRLSAGAVLQTVALCRNAGCTDGPDRWIWDVDDWVVFPWEAPHSGPVRAMPAPRRVITR
ncbi:phosphoribosyltransferase [Saccharothrix sp. ST-888]|uniref:phosphoribosyltransferase n=1 Tax=Saccharothrix sp. ST-888 TaxID=1427391 RepID=UPI000698B9E9|nr:phosphoribosyltransferase family protein [Saccharothrix sp. ST-888]